MFYANNWLYFFDNFDRAASARSHPENPDAPAFRPVVPLPCRLLSRRPRSRPALLQVNFRGSCGRGVTFMEAGYREYGGKMMNDLIDGVKWANARADIDAARVCVFGASFGGYAALMLPVRAPTMFKCTVGYSGRYDLAARYDEEAFKGKTRATNYLIKTVGNDPAMLASSSPTMLAEQIKIPVLLVHGSKDKTTELPQAEKMRDALIKAGHPAEWVLEKYEDHGFYDSEHRKQFYQRLEAFLAKYIGPK
ncbi:MAG: prolyl oligopeptidase family serine peptidase [Pseudomonadota bacterium]|nr:prolyl oligopeptidase family serine peptidase [Pseudomonadota bacterium]